ncbi:MAG: Crp/Fnr family transcriptional regulator [Acidobacteriota bacterium]|nr:Crp/Fnr family transcriptional regulator [Acidobacteriota bacterium]
MFCNLSPEALADFDKIGTQQRVTKGTVLFREADPGLSAVVICSGQVKLSCTSKEGKTLILKIAMPGDVLGLSAVITGATYEVTAEALLPTQVKFVERADLVKFLEQHGEASMHAAKTLSEEYKSVFFDARRLALSPSVAGRLATVLLDWGRTAACGKPEMRFTMALTHEELANMAGTSRETVTRLLGKFQKDKLIQVRGASILILSPDRLAQLSA